MIDGNARRALERARPDIAFPVFRLNTELSQRERARLRLSLNAMRKQMTASQFALAVALEHRGELRVGPGQRKKNSPVQGYSRDELASRYGITRSLLDAAITVARDGRKSAIESVFDPVKKMDVTTVAKQIKNEQNARELGTTGDPGDLWITPRNILNAVDATFAGDWHDAFTLPSNPAGAPLDEHGNARIYTETNNAFTQPGYERMWANVPFSQLEMSLQWAARHAEAGRQIYLLCPAYTDRPYVQEAIRKANDVLLLRDRLVFGKPRSNGTVEFAAQAMFAVIILGFNVSTQHLIDHGVLGTLVNAPRYEDVAADEEWYEALAAQQQQIDADRASFDEQYRAWVACEVAA